MRLKQNTHKMKTVDYIERSIAKTVTYRVLIIVSNAIIIYLITKRLDITAGFTLFSGIMSTFLYYFHERIWNMIHWGKGKK